MRYALKMFWSNVMFIMNVTLVSLIYMYINRQDSLVIMKGYVQFREALSKEARF